MGLFLKCLGVFFSLWGALNIACASDIVAGESPAHVVLFVLIAVGLLNLIGFDLVERGIRKSPPPGIATGFSLILVRVFGLFSLVFGIWAICLVASVTGLFVMGALLFVFAWMVYYVRVHKRWDSKRAEKFLGGFFADLLLLLVEFTIEVLIEGTLAALTGGNVDIDIGGAFSGGGASGSW